MVERTEVVQVTNLSNLEFFERFAAPGRIGLVGGPLSIDSAIRRVQKKQRIDQLPSLYSHAFFCEGMRVDGWHWVLESDIDIGQERLRFGVQESRIDKYGSTDEYPHLAILDFRIPYAEAKRMTALGLELLANRTRYSLRDIADMWIGLNLPNFGGRSRSSRDAKQSLVCSAFVHHLCRAVGLDLIPDIATKLTTPEDIWQTKIPHVRYMKLADEPGQVMSPRQAIGEKVRAVKDWSRKARPSSKR